MPIPPLFKPSRRDGFALILVVLSVTLLTALTIFFLSDVGRERRGVSEYSRGGDARHLSDTAVNLVMGQINAATKEGTADTPVSWASQPGMIRTYGTNGTLSNAYKLYSWDNLIEGSASGVTFDPNAPKELPGSAWSQNPSQYTDLNAPVNGVYPIADPTIATVTPDPLVDTSRTGQTGTPLVTGSTLPPWDFPEAFSVVKDTAKGYYTATGTSSNPLPMPVKWLYVLQDGSWTAPSSATASGVTFTASASNPAPSAANPIVGRIAFWTDDETAKVNINTASEGSFWDTPKAATQDDIQFAGNPPAKNEFQRIVGHPATTSLSAVFPELRLNGFNRWASGGGSNSVHLQELQNLYSLSPRIDWGSTGNPAALFTSPKNLLNGQWGGSQSGTVPVTTYTATYAPSASTPVKHDGVFLDSDRLYATADDLWFQPLPATNSPSTRPANTAFGSAPTALTATQMAKRLFLFTANSRAPETTLFETPRISLWPITWPYASATYHVSPVGSGTAGAKRTAPAYPTMVPNASNIANNPTMTYQEKLLAFDSTLNQGSTTPLPFYFQRQNPDSPTSDWSNIKRNQDLVKYLRSAIDRPFPGMSSNLTLKDTAKWGGQNADWIALNCFDFSRSLINQYTYNQSANNRDSNGSLTDYQYAFTGLHTFGYLNNGSSAATHYEANAYTVSPLRASLNGTTYYTTEGAFPALKEASVVFYATGRRVPVPPTEDRDASGNETTTRYKDPLNWKNLITFGSSGTYPATSPLAGTAAADHSQTTSMQAVLLLSFSGMSPGVYSARGVSYFSPVFWVKVTRVDGEGFKVNNNDINLPVPGNTGNTVQYSTVNAWAGFMAAMPASLCTETGATKTFNNVTNAYNNWSLVSNSITVLPDDTTFTFKGSKIKVDLYACVNPNLNNGDIKADPTINDAALISSQIIDFDAWSAPSGTRPSPLPIPLAPRWNVKQASTVKMPTLNYTTNTCVNGWQTELVPLISILASTSAVTPLTDPRGPNYNIIPPPPLVTATDIANSKIEPLIYAYTDSTYNESTGLPLLSPRFQTRIDALKTKADLTGGLPPPYYAEGQSANNSLFYHYNQPGDPIQAYQLITPYDAALSMVVDPTLGGTGGDARLTGRGINSATGGTGYASFVPIDKAARTVDTSAAPLHVVNYGGSSPLYNRSTDQMQHHSLGTILGQRFPTGYWLPFKFGDNPSPLIPTVFTDIGTYGSYSQGSAYPAVDGYLLGRDAGDAAVGVDTNVTNRLNSDWDWTALPGNFADGGYINRPDQDYEIMSPSTNPPTAMRVPYYNDNGIASTDSVSGANLTLNVFVPNRQVPSPVILGTLPSSMTTGWLTLNFCPNPAKAMNSTAATHPGLGIKNTPSPTGAAYSTLPDHLLLDLFWMPIAEPYPISDQFSTAGKVNLNYAMMPFPYIQRKTGMNAVLKSVLMAAQPTPKDNANYAKYYKSYGLLYKKGRLDQTQTRFPIDVNATLKAFDYKFSQGDIFRSASQVCDVFMYPNSARGSDQQLGLPLVTDNPAGAPSAITNWWKQHSLTADNVREDPYNAIYSRITTKSNTFTVHWKVQSLKKRTTSDQATWTENQDAVVSELRGSTLIERYIDPNATNLPDYATKPDAQPLSQFYKWRVVSENYFRP